MNMDLKRNFFQRRSVPVYGMRLTIAFAVRGRIVSRNLKLDCRKCSLVFSITLSKDADQLFSLGRSPGISKEGGFQYSHESMLSSQYSLGTWYIMRVRQQFSLLSNELFAKTGQIDHVVFVLLAFTAACLPSFCQLWR